MKLYALLTALCLTASCVASFQGVPILSKLVAGQAHATELPPYRGISLQSGVVFHHTQTASQVDSLRDVMGGGVCAFDFNSDGHQDLYFVNGSGFTHSYGRKPWWYNDTAAHGSLFANDGHGHFTEVTQAAGLAGKLVGMGCAVADFDNDGHADLYLTNFGPDRLYRNLGDGRFEDVTIAAGFTSPHVNDWHTSAVWFDFDNDGFLDLYTIGFVHFDKLLNPAERNAFFEASIPTFLNPSLYDTASNRLLRNNGDGSFTDVTNRAGIANISGRGLNAVATDLNGDGLVDLYVANERSRNALFLNLGDGRFRDVADQVGGALLGNGPVVAGDYDGDGRIDLYLAARPNEPARLLRNVPQPGNLPRFVDTGPELFNPLSGFGRYGWGATFLDHNLDGRLDLFVAHGGAVADFDDPFTSVGQPDILLTSRGRDGFVEATLGPQQTGGWPRSGRSVISADLDHDGHGEIVINNNNQTPFILQQSSAGQGHWMGIRLIGTKSNRDGVGAIVRVRAGSLRATRQMGDAGFLSQSKGPLLVGLRNHATVDALWVEWPSGTRQRFEAIAADQYVTITEGQNQLAENAPPVSQPTLTKQSPLAGWPAPVAAAVMRGALQVDLELAQEMAFEALSDPRPEVRLAAVNGMQQLDNSARLAALSSMRADPSAAVRIAVVNVLGRAIAPSITETLVAFMADPDPQVREATIAVVGKLFRDEQSILRKTMLRKRGAVVPLVRALSDRQALVRQATVEALGATESYRAVVPVMDMLTDHDPAVRQAAAKALGSLRDTRAMSLLLEMANTPLEPPRVRAEAMVALARMNNDDAIPSLLRDLQGSTTTQLPQALNIVHEVLANADSVLVDRHRFVMPLMELVKAAPIDIARQALAELLPIKGHGLSAALVALPLKRQDALGEALVVVLAALGEMDVERFSTALQSPWPDWQRRNLITRLGHTRSTPAMVELLSRLAVDANQSAMVRRAAVRALRGAGTAQFPDNLIRISLDGPPGVRLFAIDLLAHQGNNPRALIQVIEADLPDTLRIRAMRHAARSGQLNAVPILIQIAKHRDHSTHLRQAAIFSMGLLGDQHSAIHLRALAQTGPVATRVVACKALAQFSDAQSRDLLRRIGLDPTLEDALRVTAIESLANLRDDALLNWLQSDGSSH